MRVAEVTLDGNLPRYGVGLVVVRLTEALARRGNDVALLCRAANARDVGSLGGARVVPLTHRGGLFGGRRAYVAQVRAGLGGAVDAVHVHGLARMAWWLRAPRSRRGAPLLVTAHATAELGAAATPAGGAPGHRARRHAAQVRAVLARADLVTAPSRWFAQRLRDAGARHVEVVGWGRTDESPAMEPIPHRGFVVLALTRLVPEKGADVLIDAFAEAFADDPEARLVIGGDGPELASLEARAAAAGLASRVCFPGYLEGEARRRTLAGADVFAVATRGDYETFCCAALDASAVGLPLVVADGGALPERVAGGEGLVARSGDVPEWSDALRRLRDDPGLRQRMGDAGRRAGQAATWDHAAAQVERLVRGLGPA